MILANAKHVRALPEEKSDNKDGKRLASLVRHGLIGARFVPPRDIRGGEPTANLVRSP
jgi:hypothetical protein